MNKSLLISLMMKSPDPPAGLDDRQRRPELIVPRLPASAPYAVQTDNRWPRSHVAETSKLIEKMKANRWRKAISAKSIYETL